MAMNRSPVLKLFLCLVRGSCEIKYSDFTIRKLHCQHAERNKDMEGGEKDSWPLP